MTHLLIGDRTYSSWSLRGWLLLHRFGIPFCQTLVDFSGDNGSVGEQLADFGVARTVPTVVFDDGAVVSESLAIAEELATRHPEARIWPRDPVARATARTLAAEMASGFSALRGACPMNLRCAYTDFTPDAGVRADLDRIMRIWAHARATCGGTGPWLCGDYSAADAFFAPVAARIAGYRLAVGTAAQKYVNAHLADPAFLQWRAMALVHGTELNRYARDHALRVWPGPVPLSAREADDGPSVNDTCPYSDKPVTHF